MSVQRNLPQTTHITLGLCATLFALAASSSPTVTEGLLPRSPAPDIPSTANETCGFLGMAEMYGIGIRVGVYCQALASIVAGAYYQESGKDIQFANGYFRLAFFIALCYLTATNGEFEAVEASIVVLLALCSVLYNPDYDYDNKQLSFSSFMNLIICQLTPIGIFLYSVWFWFIGLDKLAHSPCNGIGFFFTQVSLYGWFRTLGKVVSLLYSVLSFFQVLFIFCQVFIQKKYLGQKLQKQFEEFTGKKLQKFVQADWDNYDGFGEVAGGIEESCNACFLLMVIRLVSFVFFQIPMTFFWVFTTRKGKCVQWLENQIVEVGGINVNDRDKGRWRGIFLIPGLLVLAFLVLSIEFIIRWNGVTGVNSLASAGQLIPFLIGFSGLVMVLQEWDREPSTYE